MTFLSRYLHHVGTNEVPRVFHRWTCLSVLAAVMSDRVWLPKGATRLRPNLYVFLVGPSGLGKNEAIGTGLRLLKDFATVPTEYSRTTAAAVIDRLAAKGASGRSGHVYFATPELSMAVGSRALGDELIKLMTELYGGSDVPLTERTRTSGRHVIKNHCVNWIAGSTKEWMRDCVTREAVEGGFFARVACIQAAYDLSRRIVTPQLPADYEATVEHLHNHIRHLLALRGEMAVDPQAAALHDEWYLTRPVPAEDVLLPSWKREDDVVRKLSMLLALADDDPQMTVQAVHEVEAQRLAAEAVRPLGSIIDYIGADSESEGMRRAQNLIQLAGAMPYSALARAMAKVGITHDRLKLFLDTLMSAGMVTRDSPTGTYTWQSRPYTFTEDDDDYEPR